MHADFYIKYTLNLYEKYEMRILKFPSIVTPKADTPRLDDIVADLENILQTVFVKTNETN